jgi:hypothetical protein
MESMGSMKPLELRSLISKAIPNPKEIFPFVNRQLRQLPGRAHDQLCKLRYTGQKSKLLDFRSHGSWALIVLDACRFDRFDKIAPEYLDLNINPVAAAATDTFGYLRKCWNDDYKIKYITGAAPVTSQDFDWSKENVTADGLVFSGESLYNMYQGYTPTNHITDIIEVWRESWDESLGVCPPEPVTDRAITQSTNSNHMVVHYFQPHEPYIGKTKLLGDIESSPDHLKGGAIGTGIWKKVRSGEISDNELLQAYDDNLRRVLGEVSLLISHIWNEFDHICIMGDHGEALGKYGQYTHSIPHPKVRMVPWAVVNDIRHDSIPDRTINLNKPNKKDDISVESRLKDLGYI